MYINSIIDSVKFYLGIDNVTRQIVTEGDAADVVGSHTLSMLYLFNNTYHRLQPGFNAEKIFRMTLQHDAPEIRLTDIIFKNAAQKQDEDIVAGQLYSYNPELMKLWSEYQGGQTIDAQIVKQLDVLQASIRIYLEGGQTWRICKRTYEEECRLYPVPEGDPLYSELLRDLRIKARDEGMFYQQTREPLSWDELVTIMFSFPNYNYELLDDFVDDFLYHVLQHKNEVVGAVAAHLSRPVAEILTLFYHSFEKPKGAVEILANPPRRNVLLWVSAYTAKFIRATSTYTDLILSSHSINSPKPGVSTNESEIFSQSNSVYQSFTGVY